jgi:protein-L-isoaspartate O-methyltransferase
MTLDLCVGVIVSQEDLVSGLKEKGIIKTDRVENAMKCVERKIFVPEMSLDDAYKV